MTHRTVLLLRVASSLAVCVGGCVKCPQTHATLAALVAEHNANAAPVKRLWARVRMDMVLADSKGRTLPVSCDGLLLLHKSADALGPHDFVLIGRELGQDVFRVGSSTKEDVYYFWYRFGDQAEALWGRSKLAGAPGVDLLPIDPYQLLAILNICELPADPARLPVVALAMNADPCAYVVTYIDRQAVSGRILFRREVYYRWSDTPGPHRPYKVNFFSPDGRRLLTASLAGYKPVRVVGGGRAVMPTDIRLESMARPGQARLIRKIRLQLSQMTTADKWDQAAVIFNGPALPPGIRKTQLDKHIRAEKGTQ